MLHKPSKNVANSRLSCFIAKIARDNSVFNYTAHSFYFFLFFCKNEMTNGRPHRHHKLPWSYNPCCRYGNMCVYITNSDSDTWQESNSVSHLFHQIASCLTWSANMTS